MPWIGRTDGRQSPVHLRANRLMPRGDQRVIVTAKSRRQGFSSFFGGARLKQRGWDPERHVLMPRRTRFGGVRRGYRKPARISWDVPPRPPPTHPRWSLGG